ncbi:MAG: sugar phosphate isomerase/epimerase family protein [Thermoproteota archaeon]
MYFALSTGSLGIKVSLEREIELASNNGFKGLYLNMAEVAKIGVDKVSAMLRAKNLLPAAWWLPLDLYGSQDAYEKSLSNLRKYADVAKKLGCLRTSTYILSFSDTLPFEKNYEFHVKRIKPAAEILSENGCLLGLEFLGPKTLRKGHRYEFIHTMSEMLRLCSSIGTGNVGLLLDSWHWYTSHCTVGEIESLSEGDVVDVHVNDAPKGVPIDEQIDNVRRMPGETGVIDIVGFLRALEKIGYGGPVMAEPFAEELGKMPDNEACRLTAESLRKIWSLAGLRF